MDSNSNGNILCSIKWHHGVRIGPHATKGIKEILRGAISDNWKLILGTNFILLMSPDIILIYEAAVLFAVGNGLMWPSVMSILSKSAGTIYQVIA